MNRNPDSPSPERIVRPASPIPPQVWVTGLTAAFVALAVFAASLRSDTFIRTPDSILRLPLLAHAKHVPRIFHPDFMAFTDGTYRPLPYALIALVRTVVSPDNVLFWRLWLVAFHVLNAVLVYAVARRLADGATGALVALGVFLLHPMASAFANQINLFPVVLSGTFYLGTFLCYLRWVHTRGISLYLLGLVLYAGGLLCSHALLTLPVLILLYELLRERTGVFRTIARLLPFAAVTGLWGYVFLSFHPQLTYYVYPPRPYAGTERYWMYSFTSGDLDMLAALVRGRSTGVPVSGLLGKMHESLDVRSVLVCVVFLVWFVWSLRGLRRKQWLAVGTFLLLFGALPRFNAVQSVTADYASWTWQYVPFAGFALLAGAVAERVCGVGGRWWRRVVTTAVTAAVVACGVFLVMANIRARTPTTYWGHAFAVNPASEILSVQLGRAHLAEGNPGEARKYLFSPAVHGVQASCLAMARYYMEKGDSLAAAVHLRLADREKEYGLKYQTGRLVHAEVMYRTGALDWAEGQLGKALTADPYNTQAMKLLAELLATKGYLLAAIVYLEDAVRIDPGDADAARRLRELRERLYEPEKFPVPAKAVPPDRDWLTDVLTQSPAPSIIEAKLRLAETYPDDPMTHLTAGIFLSQTGRHKEAVREIDQSLKSLPSYAFALTTKLWAYQNAGEMDQALACVQEARHLTPFDAYTWTEVGYNRTTSGQTDLGIACFRTALQANPLLPGVHIDLGRVLAQQGKYLEALSHYRRALELTRGESELLYGGMAYALQGLREFDEAITYYRKAIAVKPTVPTFYRYLAKCFEGQGRYEESVRTLSEGLAANPGDVGLSSDLAAILSTAPEARLRDGERALRLAQAACRKADPVTPQLLDVLAAAYAETGRFDSAVVTANEAAALARRQGDAALAGSIDRRRQLYEIHQPLRMAAPASQPP